MSTGRDEVALDALVEPFFSKFDELVEADGQGALDWVESAPSVVRDMPEWALCKADALLATRGTDAAIEWIHQVLCDAPGQADLHHRLAEIYEFAGQRAEATAEHLETLSLDLATDELTSELDESLLERIERVAASAITGLGPLLRIRLAHVPVLLESRPSVELVRDGYDSRLLGLFSGPCSGEVDTVVGPELTEIRLYVRCLWDAFGLDEEELLDQVRLTVLHEIGHYFGLNETEVAGMGLE